MWMLFGFAAIVMAILNVAWAIMRRDAKVFRFFSLALTALTVCAFYGMNEVWVLKADWSALMDVVPGTARALWVLTSASILVNGLSLFTKTDV